MRTPPREDFGDVEGDVLHDGFENYSEFIDEADRPLAHALEDDRGVLIFRRVPLVTRAGRS